MMELTTRYGMEFNPFLKNSKDIIFESREYTEGRKRLDYLTKTNGFGLLTGAPGRGKTTLVRTWAKELNISLYKVIYTSLSTITVNDFYRHLAYSFGVEPAFRKTDNFNIIQSEINRLTLEKKQIPIIIIDEANYINTAVLNDFKILFNFEMDSKDRAVVLLVGLPSINHTLKLSVHEPLRQRIIMNYNIDGLSKEESRSYIELKLQKAGCTKKIFDESAVEAVVNAADGTARLIDKLCNNALVIGHNKEVNCIDADTVMQAINDSILD